MNTDGNIEALRRYEAEQEKNEKAFEAFEDELINELGVLDDYQELEQKYDRLCIEYGYTDKTFYEWIGEQ